MNEKIYYKGMKLIEVSTGKELSKEQHFVYKKILDDIPEKSFESGIILMLRERVYSNIPMPGEIRDYCLGHRTEDLDIKAAEAKNKLKDGITRIGSYTSVIFDDPIIHLVVRDLGGWIKLGQMDMDEFKKYLTFDFPKLYKAYSTATNIHIPLILNGKAEEDGIKYIGNEEKAKKWVAAYIEKYGDNQIQNRDDMLELSVKGLGE